MKYYCIIALVTVSQLLFAQEKPELSFGGAFRLNLISEFYDGERNETNTKFAFDTWRLDTKASYQNLGLDFEYRFYPAFGTHFIKKGYFHYSGEESSSRYEVGITQVPFGITTYASHSWWFQNTYYVGLEDDHDIGIKGLFYPSEKDELNIAYFRQAEPEGPKFGGDVTFTDAGPGRYSYDIVPSDGESNRELNQLNIRYEREVNNALNVGLSGQIGGIYNSVLEESKTATAYAVHGVYDKDNWNVKAEFVGYDYGAVNDNGEDLDIVTMGAYGFPYDVATEANMYVIGVAKSFPIENAGPITNIQAYVDYTYTDKTNESFYDTHQLVPGMLITAGSMYIYADAAMGKNQPWLQSEFGVGQGAGREDANWNTRLNINFGYYFSKDIQ